jgi:hypothetical protein
MPKIKAFLKDRWKLILNILTIVALIIFVFAIRHQISETFSNIQRIQWWVFILIVLLQLWNYDAQTRLYVKLFGLVGNHFSYRRMFVAALELNFINNILPSGGVSGISYFGARMRSTDVTAGKATLVQILKLGLLYLSFEILLAVGIFILAAGNRVNNLMLLATAVIATSIMFGTALFVYIIRSKNRVEQTHRFVRGTYNQLLDRVVPRKRHHSELRRVHFWMLELHENFKTISSKYKELKDPLIQALFANLSEMLCIYVIYIAFGHWVNFGAIIVAYAVANFAGLISVLPAGVGVYEALMTSVLVAAGIPVSLSLPVTVMYRVITAIVQLVPGYFFYHRAIQGGKLASHKA